MGAGRRCEFCLLSYASALLDGVLIKLDQNALNLLRRNVRLIQLGINCHKNDVCGRFEVVHHAIARTFAFLNITVPHPHLKYGVVRPRHIVSRQPYNVVRYISYVPHIQLEGIKHEEIHRDAN